MEFNERDASSRICGAADRLLEAISSAQGRNAIVDVYTGSSDDPEARDVFTADEYSEALEMLMRLDMLDTSVMPAPPPASSGHGRRRRRRAA